MPPVGQVTALVGGPGDDVSGAGRDLVVAARAAVRLVAARHVADQPLATAERILKSLTRRAFRRVVNDDDVAPLVSIVQTKLNDNYSFELAMRAALNG